MPHQYYSMKLYFLFLLCLITIFGYPSNAFSSHHRYKSWTRSKLSSTEPTVIEVCGFKDCKSRGGGAKLEKLFQTVIIEKNLDDRFQVQTCDCQGECGYGPNIVMDGRIVNNIKDRDAILQVLLDSPQEAV